MRNDVEQFIDKKARLLEPLVRCTWQISARSVAFLQKEFLSRMQINRYESSLLCSNREHKKTIPNLL